MALKEIPADLQEAVAWVLRGARAVLEGIPPLLGDFWGSVARSVREVLAPVLPALSRGQQDALVTVALVVGGGVAIFLLVQMLLLLVPSRHGTTTNRLRHRHQ
jgi:hypothetical protein